MREQQEAIQSEARSYVEDYVACRPAVKGGARSPARGAQRGAVARSARGVLSPPARTPKGAHATEAEKTPERSPEVSARKSKAGGSRDSERKSRGWSTWDNASRESGRDGMPARHSRVSESPMI